MSYDFELHPRSVPVDVAEVRAWIASRPHWSLDAVTSAVYENSDTGVSFVLDLNEPAVEPPLVAIVNLYRPSFFIREIEFELRSLAASFDLTVFDPQDELWAPHPLTAEWLSEQWWRANATSYQLFQGEDRTRLVLPRRRLDAAWWWNYRRSALQDAQSEDIFVPSVMVIDTDRGLRTAAVWSDAIPVILPEVDDVIIYRDRLAPRRLFRAGGPDSLLVGRPEVVEVLAPFSTIGPDRLEFRVPSIPPGVENWVRGLPARELDITGVPWDQVHDVELVHATDPPA